MGFDEDAFRDALRSYRRQDLDELLANLEARPGVHQLALRRFPESVTNLLAMAKNDEAVRQRLLQVIREVEGPSRPRISVDAQDLSSDLKREIFEAIEAEGYEPEQEPPVQPAVDIGIVLAHSELTIRILELATASGTLFQMAHRLAKAVVAVLRRERKKKLTSVAIYGPKGEVLKRVDVEQPDS